MAVFFDTNVVFHCVDGRTSAKRDLARRSWGEHSARGTAVISAQGLAEFIHAARRKLRPQVDERQLCVLIDSLRPMVKVDSSKGVVRSALAMAIRHQLSIYDAMIVQAAIDGGATTL